VQQAIGEGTQSQTPTLKVSRIEKDPRPPVMIYEPGHPDADANGMVAMPNINLHEEMADMIAASRAFEANLAVVKNSRAMALQTLSIGKH
jgi:flagellar basal-body rod protein FlgC